MKYQLVIQFSEELGIDLIEALEDKLSMVLMDAEVDGHDIGSNEVNIFIYTNNPKDTFEIVKFFLKDNDMLEKVKVAYREISKDFYICLWPNTLRDFTVK
jgi:hypothetical protein